MICQACHRTTAGVLCRACRGRLRPASDRILDSGIRLIAAYEHVGPARTLVHQLKYRGILDFVALVAEELVERIPPVPLVPVPRALSRRIRYGVDPAQMLAQRLSFLSGLPVVDALWPPVHSVRRAGGDHSRPAGRFAIRRQPDRPIQIVDDVVTTGRTLASAADALGENRVIAAVVANATDPVSSLLRSL